MGLVFVPITLLATGGVTANDAGLASGLFNTAQQVGGSLGLAILSTLAASKTTSVLNGLHGASDGGGERGRARVRLSRRLPRRRGDARRRAAVILRRLGCDRRRLERPRAWRAGAIRGRGVGESGAMTPDGAQPCGPTRSATAGAFSTPPRPCSASAGSTSASAEIAQRAGVGPRHAVSQLPHQAGPDRGDRDRADEARRPRARVRCSTRRIPARRCLASSSEIVGRQQLDRGAVRRGRGHIPGQPRDPRRPRRDRGRGRGSARPRAKDAGAVRERHRRDGRPDAGQGRVRGGERVRQLRAGHGHAPARSGSRRAQCDARRTGPCAAGLRRWRTSSVRSRSPTCPPPTRADYRTQPRPHAKRAAAVLRDGPPTRF